jgi:hypothetical protein
LATGTPAGAQYCPGDCDRDGTVFISEIVTGVNQALGSPSSTCTAFDTDGDDAVEIFELIAAVRNALEGCPLSILEPGDGHLVRAGDVPVLLHLPTGVDDGTLRVELDGADVTDELTPAAAIAGLNLVGTLPEVSAGQHTLSVSVEVTGAAQAVAIGFEATELTDPDNCEVLNNVECLLPYPSSRFLVPDPTTATGLRVQIPDSALPQVTGAPLSAAPFNQLDGFSPMVQILMHFPQGVDLEASDASRLLTPGCCNQPAGPPWINTRTHDERSLDADSPTVLLDVVTGERVLHWLEPDSRAAQLERQALIMRPAISLTPGHRYIVALRDLKAPGGADVVAEPAFAVLRDMRATTVEAIEARRQTMDEQVFDVLVANGIGRDDLVLAFDFVVQSESQLTRQMLSMRDQGYAYVAQVEADPEMVNFTVAEVKQYDCSAPDEVVWRDVRGTFKSPLFLTANPDLPGAPQLNVDADDMPVPNGLMDAVFTISIPCAVLAADTSMVHPIVLGHGLFGTGQSMTDGAPRFAGQVVPWTYVAGATDWRGLSLTDLGFVVNSVVGVGESQLHNFAAFPDRLRQGMLNTLVLARMMKRGLFNRDTETFRTPEGWPVFPGPDREMFYYGISLGGIMGTWLASLTPDVERFHLDVPAVNFSCLLQRSTQFRAFDVLLAGIGITDPLQSILGLHLIHELWVSAEPAGYVRHVTSDPLPGAGPAKRILYAAAWLDKQVSNQCTEIAVRSLGLPNLVPGSLQRGLPGIGDASGPLGSAYVMYDTGAFDLFESAHQVHIPPLANTIPTEVCDPHSDRRNIPAAIRQLANFLRPEGRVENFCDGDCDSSVPDEIRNGDTPCDPLAPPGS